MIHFLDYRCFTFFTNFKFIQANMGEKMADNYLALTPESLPERLYKLGQVQCVLGTIPIPGRFVKFGTGNFNLFFMFPADFGK